MSEQKRNDQMNHKAMMRIVTDAAMCVLLLLLMAFERIGRSAHEWIGLALFVLFTLHHVFNRRWSRALFSGKHTAYRILQSMCAALVLIAMLGLMLSAVPISREVFALLPVSGGLALGRSVHMLSAYWGFLFMGLHLGVHWQTVTKLIFRRFSHPSRRRKILLWTLGTLLALWGVYALFSRDLPDYLFLKTPFVFFLMMRSR